MNWVSKEFLILAISGPSPVPTDDGTMPFGSKVLCLLILACWVTAALYLKFKGTGRNSK